jgi:hypothetical protein
MESNADDRKRPASGQSSGSNAASSGDSQSEPSDRTDQLIEASVEFSQDLVIGAKDRATELIRLPLEIFRFLRHPVRFLENCPDLKTPTWVILAISTGILSAVISGLVHHGLIRFLIALLILPAGSFLATFATTSLLKIILLSVHGLKFRYRSGASIFAFANIFWWLPVGIVDRQPIIVLIGFIAAFSLAAIGFNRKLGIPIKVIGGWLALFGLIHVGIWTTTKFVAP